MRSLIKMIIKIRLLRIFNYIFFGVFYYILILAIGNMNLQSPIGGLLIIPYLFFLYRFVKKVEKHIFNIKRTWCVLQVVSCIVMVIMVFQLRVSITWDWGQLLNSAYNYTMTGKIDNPEYFMRYPNNQIWLVCLIGFFKIISICTLSTEFTIYKAASMIASICLMQLSIFFVYKTAKLIWSEKKAFGVGVAALLYVPFYLYAMFLYTDVPGICLVTLLEYCSMKLYRKGNKKAEIFYAAIFGILGAAVLHIKIIAFIIFIAVIISFIFNNTCSRVGMCIIFLCFLVSYLLIGTADNVLKFDEKESAKYELPFTHWIMMSLGRTGGYNLDDVNYTASITTYDGKIEVNIEKIKERIIDYGFMGTVKHVLYTKQCRTWTNRCIGGDDYVGREPILDSSFCHKIFSKNGDWHWICLIYTWLGHITIMIGMLFSALLSVKKEIADQNLLAGRIAVFGLFVFLSIWECNSRYLLTLTPIMILVAADGWYMVFDKILEVKCPSIPIY